MIAFVALLAACSGAHAPRESDAADRDGGVDAHVVIDDAGVPDTGTIDAQPPCADLDIDGFEDVRCGGADCDDTNPQLSPVRSVCADDLVLVRCTGGAVDSVPCPEGAPICDEATGSCVPSICGDGVRFGDEECDDDNVVPGDGCDAACLVEPCESSSDCPPEAPSCSDLRPDGRVLCRALEPGAALGSRCAANADCASGWCDLDQGRCTVRCVTHSDCGGGAGWCARHPGIDADSLGRSDVCRYGCFRDADCAAGLRCIPRYIESEMAILTMCAPPAGTVADLTPCSRETACASGWCTFAGLETACAATCSDEADCADPNLTCRTTPFPFPAGWPRTHFADCICADRDRDSWTNIACGGQDCDDTRADLGPYSGFCADAITRTFCRDGAVVTERCPGTAECDARTGRCVAPGEACGDAVLHLSERCDDGNDVAGDGCDPGCGRCRASSWCPPEEPSCSFQRVGDIFWCWAPNPSLAPNGATCGRDSDCASHWCNPRESRCSELCTGDSDCDTGARCARDVWFAYCAYST